MLIDLPVTGSAELHANAREMSNTLMNPLRIHPSSSPPPPPSPEIDPQPARQN